MNGSAIRGLVCILGVRTVRDRAAATEVGAYSVIKLGGPPTEDNVAQNRWLPKTYLVIVLVAQAG